MTKDEFRQSLRNLGLSQFEFRQRTGMSANAVSRWATGRVRIPRWVEYVLQLLTER